MILRQRPKPHPCATSGLIRLLGVITLLAFCGCKSVSASFLKGEQAAFDAITPLYERYLNEDLTLTSDERERRLRTVRAWRFSLKKNSEAVNND